jgi:hypothetical protein
MALSLYREAAKDCTIGYDFGYDGEETVRSVDVKWIYRVAKPAAIRIEYSDDNSIWTLAAALEVSSSTAATQRQLSIVSRWRAGRTWVWQAAISLLAPVST